MKKPELRHISITSITIRIFFISLFIAGCEEQNRPEGLIDENTYIDLLVEFHLSRSYIALQNIELKSIDSLNQEILNRHNVTPEEFMQSHTYYQTQVDAQNIRISKAIERLKMEKAKHAQSDTTARQE